MTAVRELLIIARYTLHESLRRRIFLAAVLLAVSFVVLFGVGVWLTFRHITNGFDPSGGRLDPVVAPTLFGLAVFGIHFLGAALAVFLGMATVRGDAERGILQQVVVRPIGRPAYIAGRLLGALTLTTAYVSVTFGCTALVMHHFAHWRAPHAVPVVLLLIASVSLITLIVTAGSVWLSAAANGILAFMLIGLGMFGGLLGQLGLSLPHAAHLRTIGSTITHVVPSEALYQSALHQLTNDQTGLAGIVVRLGPFGGSQSLDHAMAAYIAAYALVVALLGVGGFVRRDL